MKHATSLLHLFIGLLVRFAAIAFYVVSTAAVRLLNIHRLFIVASWQTKEMGIKWKVIVKKKSVFKSHSFSSM